MKINAIIAVVEPLSFSLDKSLAWTLTSQLQAKKSLKIVGDGVGGGIQMIGLIPILQPIRARISAESAFVLMMRAVLEIAGTSAPKATDLHALLDAEGRMVAQFMACAAGQSEPDMTVILMPPALADSTRGAIDPLRSYVAALSAQLWSSEPINWTTHALLLASTGQFLSTREIGSLGLSTGVLVASGSALTVEAGTKPMTVAYRNWKGAGTVTTIKAPILQGSGSCTFGGSDSEGGDWGSAAYAGYAAGGASGGMGGGGFSGGGGGGGSGGGCEVVHQLNTVHPDC